MTIDRQTNWNGIYRYDPTELLPWHNPEVSFKMALIVGWFGWISGSIIEDEHGVPEKARLRGHLGAQKVVFKKRYTKLWIATSEGATTCIPNQSSIPLLYLGDINENGTRIDGSWETLPESRRIDGQLLTFPVITGTWNAILEALV